MSFDLNDCIKKCGDVDKDFRITAVTDLTEELRKDGFTMDAASETKVVDNILRLLQDSAKEVQDVAVKALGPLVRKVSEQHITTIINQLTENIANTKRGKEELREVSNSGLKGVLRDVDDKFAEKVSNLLAPGLLAAIKSNSPEVIQECLDVSNDLLSRFGSATNAKYLQDFQDVTLPQLDSTRKLIKQRSVWVLTNVARFCPEAQFSALNSALIKKMGGDLKKQSTTIQLVGSIARNIGFRMGKHVNDFVPLLTNAVNKSSAEGDEDIKENAFQTFGSFVESCPRDIRPHLDSILALCLKFLSWDPNQLEDSEGGGSGDEGSGGDDDDDDSGMEASEDEDDDTWMVRRAAAKTITSMVNNHPDRLSDVINKAALDLVKQFKERESTARHEILGAYEAIAVAVEHSGKASDAFTSFAKTVSKAAAGLALLLSHKSVETRIAAVSVLRSVSRVTPLGEHLKVLSPGVAAAVSDSNAQLRISSLELLRLILVGSPSEVQPFLDTLFAPLEKVLTGGNVSSRVAAASMDACEAFLVAAAGKVELMNRIYKALEPLYKQTDLDSEAKEAAIRAAARAVCNLSNKLPNLQAALDVLVERLGAELTKEAATIAVGTIAESGAAVGDAWIGKVVPLLCSFCAPGARSLKIAALNSLGLVMEHFGDTVKSHVKVLEDTAGLIDVDDFTLAQLATHVATVTLHNNTKSAADVKKFVYPKVLTLLHSPLLEGISLTTVAELFRELSMLETKGFGFVELVKDLEGALKNVQASDLHIFRNVGACYAQVIVGGDQKKAAAAVQGLVKQVSSKSESERLAAIYILADVGRSRDVSEYGGVVEALAAALDSDSRAVALAASFGLGSVAFGNLTLYLPFILQDMKKNPKRQLLLLQAVKEIVSGHGGNTTSLRLSLSSSIGGTVAQDLAEHLDTLLPILLENSSSDDDLTRNAVSECLGRLAKISPDRIVPELVKRATDKSAHARSTMVTALRCAITEKPAAELDALLTKSFGAAVTALSDADVNVRFAGLQAIVWALQTKPRVVKQHITAALPAIYKETVVDESLIKTIDLGQIKHVTDNGLDKRVAAYEALYILLEVAFDTISVNDYVDPLLRGMEDVITVKESSYKIIRRMAQVAGAQVYTLLDKLVPALEKEVKRPIPKSEPQERLAVMKRACVAAIVALNGIPNASSHAKLQEVIQKGVLGGPFKVDYEELVRAQKK